ncbi:hypothetical protein O3M35_009699 [Rhynocoris fuscipes]|uniref:EF-hand domain-containing protein n=1 Tax=Rhynocoris fuscipes TaxID=488301 RepID=A0AAW1D3Z3_9HEMI
MARTRLSINVDSGIEHEIAHRVSAHIKFNKEQAKLKLKQRTEGEIECSPDEYIYLLKLWRRKANANELRNKKTQTKLLHALWQRMIKEQTEEFHDAFCDKLLQQSTFEKCLASRLNRIHNTYAMFCESSATIKSQIESRTAKVDNFREIYSVLHDFHEEDTEERKRIYELHRRLYNEKITRRREMVYEICHSTAIDLVEFALKCANFIEINKEEVPRKLIIEWKDYFYKGVCNINRTPLNKNVEEDEEESSLESPFYSTRCEGYEEAEDENTKSIVLDVCTKHLKDQDVHCYMYMTGPWFLETLLPGRVIENPNLLITGFIMHRLLEAKYPFPSPPPKPDLTEYQLRAIVTPLNKSDMVNKLRQLVNEYENENIAVVEMSDVINHCLFTYKKEKSLSKVAASLKEKPETEGKRKKEESKKSKEDKEGKSAKPKTNVGGLKTKATPVEVAEVGIQVPSEEDLLSSMGHSRAGLLGKLAFEELHGGKKISDIHLINMMIEYLKSFENLTGWVLVNYPMTFQQAALLEYILQGNLIRLPTKLLEEAKRNLEDNEEPISEDEPLVDPKSLKLFENEIENLRDLSLKQLADINKEIADRLLDLGEYEMTVDEETMYEEEITDEEELYAPTICKVKSIKELLRLRTSNILPRPNKITYFSESKSYFTKYISIVKNKVSFHRRSRFYNNPHYPFKLLDPLPYYETAGISTTVSYRKIDANFLKDIAEMLMEAGDNNTFTESTVTISSSSKTKEAEISGAEKEECSVYSRSKLSSFTGTTSSADKIISPSKTITSVSVISAKSCKPVVGEAHTLNIHENKYLLELKDSGTPNLEKFIAHKAKEMKLRFMGSEEADEEGEEEAAEEEETQKKIIHPGDENWNYTEFPIPITLQRSLATFWESIENSYLNNLEEIFLIYRNLDSKLIPYKMYIRKACNRVINSPDNKQAAVSDFQLMLNYIDTELRTNDDMKAELHCRAFELFNELCQICDERRRIAEDSRREIIGQNWVAHQAYTFVNVAISLMQVEMDRFMDTVQILYDYYVSSLQKLPVHKKLEKVVLDKVKYPGEAGFVGADDKSSVKRKSWKYKMSKLGKKVNKSSTLNSVPYNIELVLLNDDVKDLPNPALALIVDSCESAVDTVKYINKYYNNIIKYEYNLLMEKQLLRKQEEDAEERGRMQGEEEEIIGKRTNIHASVISPERTSKASRMFKKKKKGKGREKVSSESSDQIDFPSQVLEGPYNNLFWEWSVALKEETNRILLRIQLIESRVKNDLDELIFISQNVFQEFTNEITSRYHKEVTNVHLLLNMLKAAIEEGKVIKPMIVIDKDDFFVDGGTLMHPDIPPPPPTPLNEPSQDYVFSIRQLTNIMEKLNIAAPDGIIEDSLVLILEDMLMFGSECGYPYLPKGWSDLTNIDIRTLVECLFAESAMIDWKDFLIFGLNIEFPTIEQLLDARDQLIKFDRDGNETIGWNDFQMVLLWFETEFQENLHEDLRLVLIKEFLFKLYSVNNYEMNYSAMLMAFCRDEVPAEGFAKALSLLSGKPFVSTARDLFKCKDMNALDAPYMAEYIIDLLLHNVMVQCEGVIIAEEDDFIELNKYEYFLNKMDLDRETELKEYVKEELRRVGQQYEEPHQVGIFQEGFWVSLVPYDLALAVIMYFLHFHPLSCDHVYRQLKIADELKELFMKKGRWNVIRIFDLFDSDLMKSIISATNMFKSVNVATMVEQMVAAKLPPSLMPIKKAQKYPKF